MPKVKKSAAKKTAAAKKPLAKTKLKSSAPRRGRPPLAVASKKSRATTKPSQKPKAKAVKTSKKALPIALEISFINNLHQVCTLSEKQEKSAMKQLAVLEKKLTQAENKHLVATEKLSHAENKVENLPTAAAKNQLKNAKKTAQQTASLVDSLSHDLHELRQTLMNVRQDLAKYTQLQQVITTFAQEWRPTDEAKDMSQEEQSNGKKRGRKTKPSFIAPAEMEEVFAIEEAVEENEALEDLAEESLEATSSYAQEEEDNIVELADF